MCFSVVRFRTVGDSICSPESKFGYFKTLTDPPVFLETSQTCRESKATEVMTTDYGKTYFVVHLWVERRKHLTINYVVGFHDCEINVKRPLIDLSESCPYSHVHTHTRLCLKSLECRAVLSNGYTPSICHDNNRGVTSTPLPPNFLNSSNKFDWGIPLGFRSADERVEVVVVPVVVGKDESR